MVQKNDKLEIILDLLKNKENHIRGLSKNLRVSHTTTVRKTNELISENVLDFRIDGRNKVLKIKKTVKARNYILMAEEYKTNKLLEVYPKMSIILKEVLSRTRSSLIVLFGSYAKFEAGPKSDIDIYAETKDAQLKKELRLINKKISLKVGKFDPNNNLIKEILRNHVIIKGYEVFYDKTKFFG